MYLQPQEMILQGILGDHLGNGPNQSSQFITPNLPLLNAKEGIKKEEKLVQITEIMESVYHNDSFDNTEENLFNITEQSSEEDIRIGSHAYLKFFQRYKQSYKYLQPHLKQLQQQQQQQKQTKPPLPKQDFKDKARFGRSQSPRLQRPSKQATSLINQMQLSQMQMTQSNGFITERRNSDVSINLNPAGTKNDQARKEYLKEIEIMKLPPVPFGVVQKVGSNKAFNLREKGIGKYYYRAVGKSIQCLKGEVFDFQNNNLKEHHIETLIDGLFSAKEIDLKDNNIGQAGVDLLIQKVILSSNCKLEILNLENNNIGDRGIRYLCEALCQSTDNLVKLNISKNELTDQSINFIAKLITDSSSLRELKMHWNKLGSNKLPTLIDALSKNKRLKVLDISWNALGSYERSDTFQVGEILGRYLNNNKSLVHLDLSFNGLNEDDCLQLGEYLKENHTLLGLHMRGNQGMIDSLGFILKKPDPKQESVQNIKPGNMPFYKRIVSRQQSRRNSDHNISPKNSSYQSQSQHQKYIDKHYESDRCWICEGWSENNFIFHVDEINQEDLENIDVRIHFQYEEFRGQKMIRCQQDEKLFIIWKMLPPSEHVYYFTVNGQIKINYGHHSHIRKEKIQVIHPDSNFGFVLDEINVHTSHRNDTIINHYYKQTLKHCVPRPLQLEILLEIEEEIRLKTPWSFENSIFRNYKADTDEIVKQCFEFDWGCIRKPKFDDAEEEFRVKQELYHGYKLIKNLYRPYSALGKIGNIFAIGLNTYTDIMREVLDLVDQEHLKLNDTDMFFIIVNSIKKGEINPANGLVRYQFLEIMMRVALKKYHSSGFCKTQSEAVAKLIDKNFMPIQNSILYQNHGWRTQRYWNEGCDNALKAFRPLLEWIYHKFGGTHKKPGEKTFMTVDEFENFINVANLCNDLLFQRDICVCFNLAMMTQVNEISKDRHLRASFIEFLEALARAVDKASTTDYIQQQDQSQVLNQTTDSFNGVNEELMKERVNRSLQLKLISFMERIIQFCLTKSFKEKYEYPQLEDPDKMMFVIKDNYK
ncbi:UNKNOWN [Stylonychia lemnae]|uniref:Leucine rich repeat family protein n=1 Tax=Stylonychia lemnae TaxID=5949 RepID=A0A078AY70_STYLE|nr:UNKNOWN [Stylonychia lemnae]|eukprot:CDW85738.1 UNKNOWN [Stylonychia lemnae]